MHQGKHRIFSINDESDVKKIIKPICDCRSTTCNALTLKVTWCRIRSVQKKTYRYCRWLSECTINLDYMNNEGDRLWNWPFSPFLTSVTLILTFDRVILHTVVSTHRPLSTYHISLIWWKNCGWTDGRTDVCTDTETGFVSLTRRSWPKNNFILFHITPIQNEVC